MPRVLCGAAIVGQGRGVCGVRGAGPGSVVPMTENARPSTGDPVVDEAMAEFDEHAEGSLQDRVAAATEAHRRLQQRLADPGTGG